MSRSKLTNQINELKGELKSLLNSLFGVDTNKAPLIVDNVFNDSKQKIQKSLDLKEVLDPKLQDYVSSLKIPNGLEDIDFDSALELVKNDVFDFKDFSPILKSSINNDDLKECFNSSLPGSGGILKELGSTLSHITGKVQKSPEFVKRLMVSDSFREVDPTHIKSMINPTFINLDQPTRKFISSETFTQEPPDLLKLIETDTRLPDELNTGLQENKEDPSVFLRAYIQKTNIKELPDTVSTPLINGSFEQASPAMIDFLTKTAPNLDSTVKASIGSGALSGLDRDLKDFISYEKLNKIDDTIRGYVDQVLSKTPISGTVKGTLGKIIGGNLDFGNILSQVKGSGLDNLNLSDLGLGDFNVDELKELFSSDLDMGKLSRQLNKLNISQISNNSISNILKGGTQGDLFKIGNILNSGFGDKLGPITDLIGSGALGGSIDSLEDNVGKLKDSFLGLGFLGLLDKSNHADKIVKEIVAILPVGNQEHNDLLERIGPVVNQYTHVTLEKKGDVLTKFTDLAQKKFARDFKLRGPAARREEDKRPPDDRAPNKQYKPTAKPVNPEPRGYTN